MSQSSLIYDRSLGIKFVQVYPKIDLILSIGLLSPTMTGRSTDKLGNLVSCCMGKKSKGHTFKELRLWKYLTDMIYYLINNYLNSEAIKHLFDHILLLLRCFDQKRFNGFYIVHF